MIDLTEVKLLKLRAAKPPKLTEEQKKDPLLAAGYAWGYQNALEDAIELLEEMGER